MTEATNPAAVPQWTLGDRMRKAREFAGLTQTELSDQIGIARSSISRYEGSHAAPSRPVLLAWSVCTGVSYRWLAGEDNNFRRRGAIPGLVITFPGWPAIPAAVA